MVLGMFFIHWGLVQNGIVTKFSPVYFALVLPYAYVQFKTIRVLFQLNNKHFTGKSQQSTVNNERDLTHSA
ncbi:hypothetical protein [Salimicrobium flavidum]|uniref:Uncharacterized protein n=1 Tax=Salimicrobium flavidum TaxID=570947 RepID=A0A1N7J6U9_9BACI|nr:hypothetical protein [Salimicrobium flavidum]SIS45039.1 hypothetical protein SAMN05421687_10437 [Salimicrobium flavidum]